MGEHNGPTSSIQIIRGNWVVCRVAYDIKALWVPRPCQPPSPPSTNRICIKGNDDSDGIHIIFYFYTYAWTRLLFTIITTTTITAAATTTEKREWEKWGSVNPMAKDLLTRLALLVSKIMLYACSYELRFPFSQNHKIQNPSGIREEEYTLAIYMYP